MGQTDTAKGTRQFGCRLGDMWAGGQAKPLAHLAVSWGTRTSPHWRKQQKHHQCVRNVLALWERFYSPKRIKCHGCSRHPSGGSIHVSGDVWFTQWTNSIAIPFPLLQTAGTAPKPVSHSLSHSSQRQFSTWVTVTLCCYTSFHSYFYSHVYISPGPVPGSHWREGIPLRQLGPVRQLWFPFLPRGREKGAHPCVTLGCHNETHRGAV